MVSVTFSIVNFLFCGATALLFLSFSYILQTTIVINRTNINMRTTFSCLFIVQIEYISSSTVMQITWMGVSNFVN